MRLSETQKLITDKAASLGDFGRVLRRLHIDGPLLGGILLICAFGLVVLYSAGALVGPPLTGLAMDIWDPHGLALAIGGPCAGYVLVAGWRYLTDLPSRRSPNHNFR